MNIGIIGAGKMASGLGKAWAGAGHKVMFSSRHPDKAVELAASIGPNACGGTVAEAAKFGDVILLATPWGETENAIKSAGSLSGKVVIDLTNPIKDFFTLDVPEGSSGGEEVAKMAEGARVVKAFNSIFQGVIHSGNPKFGSENATAFYCGDDADAKKTLAELAGAIGFDPVDAGPLKAARLLERMALLIVQLGYGMGMGDKMAFKLMKR